MWFNKVKKEVYIGSAIKAKQRLTRHYSKSDLINKKNYVVDTYLYGRVENLIVA